MTRLGAHSLKFLAYHANINAKIVWPRVKLDKGTKTIQGIFVGKYFYMTFSAPIQMFIEHWSEPCAYKWKITLCQLFWEMGKKSPCLIKVHNAHREINDGNATHQFISFHSNYEWITVRVSFDSCLFGDHSVHILLIDFPIHIPTWWTGK